MSLSPAVILYDANGVAMAVSNGVAIPVGTEGLLIAGSDGTNARFVRTAADGTVRTDPTGTTTQPVSGSVTANIGTSGSLALDATLTGGTQKAIVRGGAKGTTVAADVTSTSVDANTQALHTNVTNAIDITDRAVRLVGVVYGSQGQQIKQTPTNFNLQSELAVGGTLIDPRAIRALTSSDVVTAAQGTAAALAAAWPVKVTDGTNSLPTMDVAARAAFQKLTDGTNTAAVKAASTAAVATDPAIVVAISPNNPITVGGVADVTATGALGALNAAVQVSAAGLASVGLQLAAGTLIGTIVPEVSSDGGTTWNATYFDDPTSIVKAASIAFASANGATDKSIVGVGGASLTRVRVSAYTSGTANITLRASTVQDPSVLFSGGLNAAAPPAAALMGASDGANLQALRIKAASTAAVAADPSLVVALSPNSPVKATVKPLYGANNQALTITLASLGNAAARASTAVDNTTNLFEDALLFVKLTTAAAGTSTTGYANIFVYATVDNGTTYSENASGTDAAITLVNPTNLILVAQVNLVANAVTYRAGPFSVCRQAGWDRLPQKWGIVVQNQSGATLSATAGNHAITYQGMNGQFQ